MGELENQIRHNLFQAVASDEDLKGATEDSPYTTDAVGMLEKVVLPMLAAQREAILRLAREIEDLRTS
jgi:hypothetical protein